MSLILSRYKLATFATCRRRYQLTYVDALSWPPPPTPPKHELARWRGEQFHLMVERHFRGFPPDPADIPDDTLRGWWHTFQRQSPMLSAGNRLIEYTVTVPILGYFLTGRFDLMVVGDGQAHIFDWKTEAHPRSALKLQADLQTQLYLAMAVVGGKALTDGTPIQADNVKITYWYVNNPAKSVTLRYSEREHRQNWAQLEERVAEIAAQFEDTESVWALTDNLETCQTCLYQLYCGRFMPASSPQSFEPEMVAEIEPALFSQEASLF